MRNIASTNAPYDARQRAVAPLTVELEVLSGVPAASVVGVVGTVVAVVAVVTTALRIVDVVLVLGGDAKSFAPMMNTTISGFQRVSSDAARLGQLKNPGFERPLETCESHTGATIPVSAACLPSAGPSDPASESPPIHNRNGSVGVIRSRHGMRSAVVVDVGSVVVVGSVVATPRG